jgi:hypothetical protein
MTAPMGPVIMISFTIKKYMGADGLVPETTGTAITRRSHQNTIGAFESAVKYFLLHATDFVMNFNNPQFFNTHTRDRKVEMVSTIIWENDDMDDTVLGADYEVKLGLEMMAARGWRDQLVVEVEVV